MTTEEEKKTDEKKPEENVEDVVVYNDALSALEKKAGPENAKEIQALVSLIEEELSASNEDLNGLAEDISNNTVSTDAKQKQMLNGVLGATILHDPEQAHKEARDAAYEMLTGKKNKKKNGILQEFKELISDGGIMLAAKNLLKKAMGNDLKAEAQKKKTLMDEFVKNNTEMLNNLKKKLNLPLIAATIVDINKKTDTPPVTSTETPKNTDSGIIDISDKSISERMDKVKTSFTEMSNTYTSLGGKGKYEHKNLTLQDPKGKSIVIDPKTQTLYYFEKGVAKKIMQVGLGKGNGGDVSGVSESHSTPPGILTVYSDAINTMSDGRPSLLVDGLEEANKNTNTREILIHPTGVPGGKTINKPTSLGCITMDTNLWTFCKENFSKGIMINVINDKYDATQTAYFKSNAEGRVVDMNTYKSQNIAA